MSILANHKPWCWEATQSGPDWVFIARVAPDSEVELAQIAAASAPQGYRSCARADEHCQYHQQVCSYRTFVDTSNVAAYANNLTGHVKKNLWVYNIIEVHRDIIEIECGYGGRGEEYNRAETAWLLDVFSAPGVTLRDWKVLVGGNGYDHRIIREGGGLDAFRSYIAQV